MNNDLISREWIRKEVEEYRLKQAYDAGDEMRNTMVDWIEDDIDNAPPVEPEITEKQAILLLINSGWLVNHDKELREKLERPQGDCENCDFRKFSEKFVDGIVEVMNKNGITSVEQLSEILKGSTE